MEELHITGYLRGLLTTHDPPWGVLHVVTLVHGESVCPKMGTDFILKKGEIIK